ncbi:MAG: DNA-binding transcriptional LysR family regulator [Cognaticolwellia sp.]|jgi:DNA-binding transcriptional LysR family regulator
MNVPTNPSLNWDDVRVFLAIVRAASLRQAALDLGVSRPTAGRRLDALEKRLGLRLFDRGRLGLQPTAHAERLAVAAEKVEQSMKSLERSAQAACPELYGPVRVTLPDTVAAELLMPDFAAFSRRWPAIDLQFETGYGIARLDQQQADVAIRFMARGTTPEGHLTGRLAGNAYVATYGSGDSWIGWQGGNDDAGWIAESPFPDLPVGRIIVDGALQRAAAANGMGLAQLPCFFAEPMLKRVSEPRPGWDIWVLVHPDLRHNPRLRVFRDAVTAALKGHQARLEGRSTAEPSSPGG